MKVISKEIVHLCKDDDWTAGCFGQLGKNIRNHRNNIRLYPLAISVDCHEQPIAYSRGGVINHNDFTTLPVDVAGAAVEAIGTLTPK